jgi:hypothetical protein
MSHTQKYYRRKLGQVGGLVPVHPAEFLCRGLTRLETW